MTRRQTSQSTGSKKAAIFCCRLCQTLMLVKPFPQYFALLLGLCFVGLFWWGFAGFVASGSGGLPPQRQVTAFWIGGIGYLALLLFSFALGLVAGDPSNRRFGASAGKNLKWTVISLLACFPAAFFFIGFIAPPFILTASAITLLVSSLRGYEDAGDDR